MFIFQGQYTEIVFSGFKNNTIAVYDFSNNHSLIHVQDITTVQPNVIYRGDLYVTYQTNETLSDFTAVVKLADGK